MKITHRAQPWLLQIAQRLVNAGNDSPGTIQVTWLENWRLSMHWKQTSTYSALVYLCDGPFDSIMQSQLLDAFARSCRRKWVTTVERSPVSGIAYFGGAPASVTLATLDFERMNITQPKHQ